MVIANVLSYLSLLSTPLVRIWKAYCHTIEFWGNKNMSGVLLLLFVCVYSFYLCFLIANVFSVIITLFFFLFLQQNLKTVSLIPTMFIKIFPGWRNGGPWAWAGPSPSPLVWPPVPHSWSIRDVASGPGAARKIKSVRQEIFSTRTF